VHGVQVHTPGLEYQAICSVCGLKITFVYEGHRIKVKVKGAKKVKKILFPQCKTSIRNNSRFIKHRAVMFAYSIGISGMADRMV